MTTTTTTVLNSVLQANPCTWCLDWRTDYGDFDNGDDDDDDYGLETNLDANKNKDKDNLRSEDMKTTSLSFILPSAEDPFSVFFVISLSLISFLLDSLCFFNASTSSTSRSSVRAASSNTEK